MIYALASGITRAGYRPMAGGGSSRRGRPPPARPARLAARAGGRVGEAGGDHLTGDALGARTVVGCERTGGDERLEMGLDRADPGAGGPVEQRHQVVAAEGTLRPDVG